MTVMLIDYNNTYTTVYAPGRAIRHVTHYFTLLAVEKKIEVYLEVLDFDVDPNAHNTFLKKMG